MIRLQYNTNLRNGLGGNSISQIKTQGVCWGFLLKGKCEDHILILK